MEQRLIGALAQAGINHSVQILFEHTEAKVTIFSLEVPAAEVQALWATLRGIVSETGCWPVILGDHDALNVLLNTVWAYREGGFSVAAVLTTLRKAESIDPPSLEGVMLDEAAWEPDDNREVTLMEWISTPSEENDDVLPPWALPQPWYVGLIPTVHCWEVAAYLNLGGWNACPEPEVHVACWKRWYEEYGAELRRLEFDTVVMQVARPPREPDAVTALARAQCAYCGDIVSQGTGSVAALAKELQDSHEWHFWWD